MEAPVEAPVEAHVWMDLAIPSHLPSMSPLLGDGESWRVTKEWNWELLACS